MNQTLFPRLNDQNHRRTSAPSPAYNCVAWAATDTEHWWQPGVYWPTEALLEESGYEVLELAFLALGFTECPDAELEPGHERVALYGDGGLWTHAARQLPTGKWTSKLGRAEDIEHDRPDDVAGGLYGEVVCFLKRSISRHRTGS